MGVLYYILIIYIITVESLLYGGDTSPGPIKTDTNRRRKKKERKVKKKPRILSLRNNNNSSNYYYCPSRCRGNLAPCY